jgi:hypothetical protein
MGAITMYQRLDTIDWSFLLGKKVQQICIGPYDIQIHMFPDAFLRLESPFEHKGIKGSSLWSGGEPEKATTLVSLMGHSVEKVVAEGDDALIIEYDNGELIKIHMKKGGYHSFTALSKDIEIYV